MTIPLVRRSFTSHLPLGMRQTLQSPNNCKAELVLFEKALKNGEIYSDYDESKIDLKTSFDVITAYVDHKTGEILFHAWQQERFRNEVFYWNPQKGKFYLGTKLGDVRDYMWAFEDRATSSINIQAYEEYEKHPPYWLSPREIRASLVRERGKQAKAKETLLKYEGKIDAYKLSPSGQWVEKEWDKKDF